MKKQEKRIIEIRSKETFLTSEKRRWTLKKKNTGNLWSHTCGYSGDSTLTRFEKETKRGFTFNVYFAGKYISYFVSRADCEIIFEL